MQADEEKCDSNLLAQGNNVVAEVHSLKDSIKDHRNGRIKEHPEASHLEADVLARESTDLNSLSQFTTGSAPTAEEVALGEFSSRMLSSHSVANSALDPSRKVNLSPCSPNESKNDSALSFSNLNSGNNDKIWSLIEPEFSGAPTFDNSMNQNIFSDPSVLPKPLVKRAITGASANYNASQHAISSPAGALSSGGRSQLTMANSNHLYGANGTKNHSSLNWPMMSQGPTSMQSHLSWSNSLNSSTIANVPPLNSASNTSASNSLQNVWSSNFYGGPNHPKRPPPMCNQPSASQGSKKSIYTDSQPIMPGNSVLSPSNYRRNQTNPPNFKSYPTNMTGPSSIYDLGSAGSDNTSSSSDSANLRENGLLHLQERNIEAHCSPLDTLRYSLEPQLLEIMRNSTPDNKAFNFNLAYQNASQDDKKHLKSRNFGRRRGKSPFFTGNDSENLLADFSTAISADTDHTERYSRKVFVGGLPPDIDEEEITASFRRFGPLVVDWPHKAESKSYFPPKGYAFLLFQDEGSVQLLIDACIQEDDKLYLCVSSPTIKDKPVQIRPWRLSDADYVLDASMPLDPRKTVFVGGVPRPLKAVELAMIMDRIYGGVCYAGIDTDPELKYPKGAGRVAFSQQQSYIAAISARFVQLQHADIEKRVEVKPYVLDDQICDECQGARCGGKFAPYFCASISCLQYYCENCWANIHSRPGREFHKPLVKEGADRPRAVPFRWC